MKTIEKSPLKYVGGKTRLYPMIKPYFVQSGKESIVEPFAGSASTFFLLAKDNLLSKPSLLNDLSAPLIDFYESLKGCHSTLISNLHSFSDYHSEPFYKHVRAWDRFDYYNDWQLSSRYLYINKTGYNGLYRVNLNGQCNTPWGKKKNFIVNEGNLKWASTVLQGAELQSLDFDMLVIDPTKFYFIDPPYYGTFDSYTRTKPDNEFYIRLRSFIKRLDKAGAKFLLTNSNHFFIQSLFADYHQKEVGITYNVSGKLKGRKPTKELFISNMEVEHEAK